MNMRRTAAGAALIAALGMGTLPAVAPAVPSPTPTARPAAPGVAGLREAVLELHDREREGRGLRPLRADPALRRAAQRHSDDMVAGGFFSHTNPAGTGLRFRVLRSSYVRPHDRWVAAENLGWGTGTAAGPAAAMRLWLRSPPHRAHILDPRLRDIGVGVVRRTPSGAPGVTYTVVFGFRHRVSGSRLAPLNR